MWILEKSWKKQGTKNGCAIFLRPSEQMVRVNYWWSVVRDGTSTKGGRTHRGDQLRPLHQVKDSGKRIWKNNELDGARWKERSGEQWKITWRNFVNTKVDIESLESFMEPEDEEVSLRYILKYSTRGGSNISSFLTQQRKKDHFVASRKRWLAAQQESWQNEWHDIFVSRSHGESPAVPREDPENAFAAAKFAFIHG